MDLSQLSNYLLSQGGNSGNLLRYQLAYGQDFANAVKSGDANALQQYLQAHPNVATDISGNSDFKNWSAVNTGPNVQTQNANNLTTLANQLMQPLNMNDPQVKQIVQMATTQAGQQAENAGIGGPLSVQNTQGQVTQALAGDQLQRQGLAVQAASAGGQLGLANTAQSYQIAANQNAQSQGIGGTIGSIAGMALGGAGGFLLGGPAGALTGAGLGGRIGGGIGSQIGGSSGGGIGGPGNYGYSQFGGGL